MSLCYRLSTKGISHISVELVPNCSVILKLGGRATNDGQFIVVFTIQYDFSCGRGYLLVYQYEHHMTYQVINVKLVPRKILILIFKLGPFSRVLTKYTRLSECCISFIPRWVV